jgi:hypothetical protein
MKASRFALRCNELLGCLSKEIIQSQIFWFETSVLGDTGKHFRPDLFFIVKGEYHVGPIGTREGFVRARFTFDAPPNTEKCRKHTRLALADDH